MSAALHFGDVERAAETLRERGLRFAGGLRRLGLREGDVVAVLLRNDPVYADVMHACRIAGTYYCPLNWHFTPAELGFILNDCGARVVIGHGDLLDAAADVLPPGAAVLRAGSGTAFLDYEAWLAAQPAYDGPVVSPRGLMGYTSGTTGRPKGVLREPVPLEELPAQQAALRELVRMVYGIEDGCRTLLSAPLYHSAPASIAQNTLLYGELLVLAPRFDAEQTLALIERHRADVTYLTPTMYVRLLRLPDAVWQRYDISSLRFVASTGAPCAPDVKRAIIARLGPVVHETYASTEAGLITVASSADALARPGTAGRPAGAAQVRIVDESGRTCAPGEIGMIYGRQPAYPGFTYHNLPDARRAIERDGLVTLGDVGYLDAEGYLFVCDRGADMVLSGGVNIYPAEIEHALLRLPGVLDCAVIGVPDPEFGERLHALVQPEPGAVLVPEQLAAELRRVLAGYKVPRTFTLADALPRDDNGKIAKRRLREEMAGERRDAGESDRRSTFAMTIGNLPAEIASARPDLLAPSVAGAVRAWRASVPADALWVAEIDPQLADTAAFCERYAVRLERCANCVVLAARREGRSWFAACVVLATTRADVNGLAKRQLGASKISFAAMDAATAASAMEFGGITPLGLPADWPILVDAAVAAAGRVVIGSGVRRSKISLPGAALAELPNAVVLNDLGR